MARTSAKRKAIARAVAAAESVTFREVLGNERPDVQRPAWCSRIYRNNRFHVLIDDHLLEESGTARAMVVPHNGGREVFWRDLQDIKNQIFGPEATGAQFFPPESELVDEANVYWLYIGVEIPKKERRRR